MLKNLFNEILLLSQKIRNDYIKSLSKSEDNWEKYMPCDEEAIPELYKIIYSEVKGTKRDIKEQILMDFLPGYRLIYIEELKEEKQRLDRIITNFNKDEILEILPLLENYSSDYICYMKTIDEKEYIVDVLHDSDEFYIMHESIEDFFITINEFYKKDVYFVDEDGYLDYDMDKQYELGQKLNFGIEYWEE